MSPTGKSYLALIAGASILLAFAFAGMSVLIIAAVIGGALASALALNVPAWVLLIGVVSGPMLGGWLDASLGGGFQMTVDRALLVVLTFFVMVRWLRRSASFLPVSRVEWLMAVFVLLGAVSILIRGGSQASGFRGGMRLDFVFLAQSYAAPFLLYFLAKNLLREHHLKWLLRTYVMVGVFVAGVAILQYYTNVTIFSPKRFQAIHEGRAVGTLNSAPHFGIVMVISLFAALFLLLRRRGLPMRATLVASMGFMFASILLSQTRAVYLGLAASLAVAAVYIQRMRRALVVIALVGVTAGVVAGPMAARTEFVSGRLFDIVPVYNRLTLWGTSVKMVVHKPLTGFGFGQSTFAEEKGDYVMTVGSESSTWGVVPHNEFLNILVLMGLLGFVPYLLIIILCWKSVARVARQGNIHQEWLTATAVVAIASFGMYIFNGFFVETGGCWYGSNMVYCLLGAVEGCRVRAAMAPALRARPS